MDTYFKNNIAALAFDLGNKGGNVLPILSNFGVPTILTKITTYLFPIIMLMPSIPVAFLVSQSNLIQNQVLTPTLAFIVSFILPWFGAIPFLSGTYLNVFLNWSSLLFVSTSNFIFPLIVYLKCLVFRREYNNDRGVLSLHQRDILKLIHFKSTTIHGFLDTATTTPTNTQVSLENLIEPERRLTRRTTRLLVPTDPIIANQSIEEYLVQDLPDPELEDEEYRNERTSEVQLNLLNRVKNMIESTEIEVIEHNGLRSRSPNRAQNPYNNLSNGVEFDRIERRRTLPVDNSYVGRTFKSLPRWMGRYVSGRQVAVVCLVVTSSVTIANIVLNIAFPG